MAKKSASLDEAAFRSYKMVQGGTHTITSSSCRTVHYRHLFLLAFLPWKTDLSSRASVYVNLFMKQAFYNKKEDTIFLRGASMENEWSNVRFLGSVSAGFPSPADDYQEPKLDLNELVAPHPLSTYFMRVVGDSMVGACICNGDVVAIDRALTATHKRSWWPGWVMPSRSNGYGSCIRRCICAPRTRSTGPSRSPAIQTSKSSAS